MGKTGLKEGHKSPGMLADLNKNIYDNVRFKEITSHLTVSVSLTAEMTLVTKISTKDWSL